MDATPSDEEKRVSALVALSVAACDSAAKQYDDYGKTFVALDNKAQNAATVSGVILAAIVAFTSAGKLAELVSIGTWWSKLLMLIPLIGALTTIAVSFFASRLMELKVPFASQDQIDEVQNLARLPAEELSHAHVLAYHAERLSHWKSALKSISDGLARKARWVHIAQWALFSTLFFVLLLFIALVQPGKAPRLQGQHAVNDVLAWWVQLVPGNPDCNLATNVYSVGSSHPKGVDGCSIDLSLRAVIDAGRPCPWVDMKGRRAVTMTLRHKPNPDNFAGINVCELRVSATQAADIERLAGIDPLPAAWRNGVEPVRVVALGDTGCRNNKDQHCATQWQFRRLAKDASVQTAGTAQRSLVLHLGDYMYVKKDDWAAWNEYFFSPARPLLESAPWVAVRGNHESCGRYADAPIGFNLFFGHGPTLSCATEDETGATYALDLTKDLRLVVLDNSTSYMSSEAMRSEDKRKGRASDPVKLAAAEKNDARVLERIEASLENLHHLATVTENRKVWAAMHVPVLGVDVEADAASPSKDKHFQPYSTTMTWKAWQSVAQRLAKKATDRGYGPRTSVVISGDRHLFQVVPPQHGLPQQLTVGTGGVNLDPLPFRVQVDAVEADFPRASTQAQPGWGGCSYKDHGFLVADPAGPHVFAFHSLSNRHNACRGAYPASAIATPSKP